MAQITTGTIVYHRVIPEFLHTGRVVGVWEVAGRVFASVAWEGTCAGRPIGTRVNYVPSLAPVASTGTQEVES